MLHSVASDLGLGSIYGMLGQLVTSGLANILSVYSMVCKTILFEVPFLFKC